MTDFHAWLLAIPSDLDANVYDLLPTYIAERTLREPHNRRASVRAYVAAIKSGLD